MSFLSSVFGGGSVSAPNITGGQNEARRQQGVQDTLSGDQYVDDTGRIRRRSGEVVDTVERERTGRGRSTDYERTERGRLNSDLDVIDRGISDTLTRDADDTLRYRTDRTRDADRYETGVDYRGAVLDSAERSGRIVSNDRRRAGVQDSMDFGATADRADAAARQALIDEAMAGVDGAFGGYDDAFYDKHTQAFIDARKPMIQQNYEDNRRQSKFGLAERGNLRSSGSAKVFGRLQQKRATDEAALANEAVSSSEALRAQISTQRAAAEQQARFAAMLAPLPKFEGAAPGFSMNQAQPSTGTPQQSGPRQPARVDLQSPGPRTRSEEVSYGGDSIRRERAPAGTPPLGYSADGTVIMDAEKFATSSASPGRGQVPTPAFAPAPQMGMSAQKRPAVTVL